MIRNSLMSSFGGSFLNRDFNLCESRKSVDKTIGFAEKERAFMIKWNKKLLDNNFWLVYGG
jgi:hypothetical protein